MSLKYFQYSDKFFENKDTEETAEAGLKAKFFRKDPDKLILKAKENLYALNFEEALELFSKAFRNATDEDKDKAIEEIMVYVDYFQEEQLSDLDENKKGEFAKFEDELDLVFLNSDRKLNAAIRKLKKASQKIDAAEEAIQKQDFVRAAEYVKDAERKIEKAYFKKLDDSQASADDKEVVKSKIGEVARRIQEVEAQVKEHAEKINDQAERDRINKKLDKREIDQLAALEAPVSATAASLDNEDFSINVDGENTNTTVSAEDTKPEVTSVKVKTAEEELVNKDNILQVALDPELHKNPKFKKTINEVEAKRLASILWDAMDGLGTNEEILMDAFRSPSIKTLADYSFLSYVYKKVSAQKGDYPVQDLYLAVYDTLMGQIELTTAERDELANIILDRVKESFAKK